MRAKARRLKKVTELTGAVSGGKIIPYGPVKRSKTVRALVDLNHHDDKAKPDLMWVVFAGKPDLVRDLHAHLSRGHRIRFEVKRMRGKYRGRPKFGVKDYVVLY